MFEAHGFAENLVFGKLVGMNVANDGQMIASGLQILSERENVRTLRGKILHGSEDFVLFFSEAEHQTSLGRNFGMRFLGTAEQFERALVHRALADLAIEARHGFGVRAKMCAPPSGWSSRFTEVTTA